MRSIFIYLLLLVPFVSFSQINTADSLQNTTEDRYSVTLNSSYRQQSRYSSYNNNVNIVYDYKKWKINANLAYNYEESFWENDRDTYYADRLFVGRKKSYLDSNLLNSFIDVQYQISDKTKINVYTINDRNRDVLSSTDDIRMYNTSNAYIGNYAGNRRSDSDYNRNAVNALLRHDFETPNKYFTAEADWVQKAGSYYQYTYGQDYDATGAAVPNRNYDVFNDGTFDFDVYTANALFSTPTKWFDFTIGGKWAFIDVDAHTNLAQKFDADYILDLAFSPIFDYNENRQAVFTDFKKTAGKWEFQAGLKFENTIIKSTVQDVAKQNYDNKFNNLFPSANVKYSFSEQNNLALGYEKSINRPPFRFLSPALGVYNAYETYQGSPLVKPSFVDNLNLVYTFKSKYNVGFVYTKIKDNTGGLATFDTDYVIRHKIRNYFDISTYELTANASFTVLNFMESSAQLQGFYKTNESLIPEISDNWIWGCYGMLNNQFNLNKAKTLSANLNFWYKSKTNDAEFLYEERYALDLGMKILLPKQNLTINLSATDALRSLNEYAVSTVDNVHQKFRNYWDPRSFKIAVVYKFGNKKLEYSERTSQNINDYYR